jgi:DNA invertase Pin-like site-specific DNA recombinase
MATMRVAIYARVSSKGGRQEAENQLRQLRTFAVSQSWTMVHEYVDRQSAKTADREQFQLMFQSASVRGFDVLLFWSLDRLSREGTVATLNHLQRLNSYGVGYRSFTEQVVVPQLTETMGRRDQFFPSTPTLRTGRQPRPESSTSHFSTF